ncbi:MULTISPECIES: flagellar biosynthetic protein FliO [Thermodesulfobacterium]|jgi:flagellar protein FliO/FliZ|uniref:Flagellar protein n=1 Tax=Thermodesulfobacterium commune DSM 2178 TaxID=289377 RepID=A0A075WR47_9BACT|nr:MULTISPECIES: flagellar biosynthetic protein FliO [Thermodesulfobacterium]KUJ97164.1 MAG: Uncharacterized protein XD42_1189 [Thermodesulfobacterium sp. 37_54]KUK18766.1 MAG: Uncharacterized protein XD55_1177 [Thermodesulfobacterium commune]AIH03779.1 hypothetical protein HL41_02630 [Thermodesulfobacterium commune DSM 2178]KUK37577.1 MAG: Uncharacterized protein XD67_1145 [Thermodesulfobacterium commune]MBZ4681685.1 hypothetical protein [Thermodesulfobacterium sp.]
MEWFYYLQSIGILLLILSLFPIALHFYKKYTVKNMSESPIKVLAVKPISYKAQILLIEVEGKKFLVGYSDKGFNLLGEIKHDG